MGEKGESSDSATSAAGNADPDRRGAILGEGRLRLTHEHKVTRDI